MEKKTSIVPVHKKEQKKCLKNIDLLPYSQFASKFWKISFIT